MKTFRLSCLAAAVSLFAFGGSAAHAEDSVSQVSATTVQPATLIKVADLDFGSIVSGPTPGTVSVNVNTGVRTATGGVVLLGSSSQRAEFQGSGFTGVLMTVNRPSSVTLSRVGGGASNLNATLNWTLSGAGLTVGSIYLINQPTQMHRAGGTLTVPANQTPGVYQGSFTLTVNYL